MRVIARERHKGKTTDLLEHAALNGYVFVCHSQTELRRLLDECKRLDFDPPLIITYERFLEGRIKDQKVKGLVIDNAQMLLQRLAGNIEVKAIAINVDEPDEAND